METQCSEHGKLSAKLNWILGVLSVGALVVTIGVFMIGRIDTKVDKTIEAQYKMGINMAVLQTNVAIIKNMQANKSDLQGSIAGVLVSK